MNKNKFVERYLEEIEAGTAAVFAGAGLSRAAGFVDWAGLLREIAEELELDIDRETDLISVAQYHVNRRGQNRSELNRAILEEFPVESEPTKKHRMLARLPIKTWWTTNYDELIETAFRGENKTADVKYDVQQLAHTKPRRDVTVYKMHGDVNHPANTVLTRDDYESYEKNRGLFTNSLLGDLISKTFLFVGFSFTDPNLIQVLSRVRVELKDNQRTHFAIFKRVLAGDYLTAEEDSYQAVKQGLFIEDLKRFNINTILVDSYEEIDELIDDLYRSFVEKFIFISTSAADFSPWGEKAVTSFMSKLGALLTERGFRIVTGVGLGTGNAVMDGAIVAITADAEKKLDDHILIRPFPHSAVPEDERETAWQSYREDMISRAGIALYLFGNKQSGSGIVPATGMIKELKIADQFGLISLPVGGTGSTANELASEFLNSNERMKGLSKRAVSLLQKLSEPVEELEQLLSSIVDLLDEIRK